MKVCTKCGLGKAETEFYRNGSRLHAHCKMCHRARMKVSYPAYYERNKDRILAYGRRPETTRRHKDLQLQRSYSITLVGFNERLAEQDGHCAICPATQPGGKGTWHVDHDHQTGEVRGLLCHYCNTAIGSMNDDPALLRAAANYLEARK